MYDDKVKSRNPIAATIRSPRYRAKVVRSKKFYSRKGKKNEVQKLKYTSLCDT